jgi:hypothetical protein
MPFKVTNPDDGDLNVTLRSATGAELAKVSIPAHGSAVVQSVEGLAGVYAHLSIVEASEAEYDEYRKASAKLAKQQEEAAEAKATADAKEAKADAKRSEIKIAAQHEAAKAAREAVTAQKLGVVKETEATLAGLQASVQANEAQKVAKPAKKGWKK